MHDVDAYRHLVTSCNLSEWEGKSHVKEIRRLLSDAHARRCVIAVMNALDL